MPKCAECGFLSLTSPDDEILHEANEYFRENGVINVKRRNPTLVCFAGKYSLKSELTILDNADANKAVVNKERDCDGFEQWVVNRSPSDHREMKFEKEMRDRLASSESAQQAFVVSQDAFIRQCRTEDVKRADDQCARQKLDRSLAITSLVVSALAILVSALSSLVSAKILPFYGQQNQRPEQAVHSAQ